MASTLAWAVALLATLAGPAIARSTVSLDGIWEFRFAPDDRGEQERWFEAGVAFPDRIRVPGCWDAQGVGEPTDKLRHNAIGVGWYRRTFTVPESWSGRRVWLRVGGAHRSAKLWLNGQFVGEHWGYPVAFRFDVTPFLVPESQQTLLLAVDSRWHRERDPLAGTFDILDFMDVHWGGLFEPVTLEATGDVWLEDVFIQPDPAASQARVQATLESVGGGDLGPDLVLRFDVREWRWGRPRGVLDEGERGVERTGTTEWALDLPHAPLWTPETPRLLQLTLRLRRGHEVLDERTVRFGQRRLEVRGNDFYLNGERFFLRGYGDDFTFPLDLLPPARASFWRGYLHQRRAFGFNGVRHHSMLPTESYLAAADEVGMFVQPELPIAYEPFFRAATEAGRDLYRQVWRDYIRQMRNHPSVFAWCLGNELWNGFDLGPELYAMAKELDPTRPVIDTDGVPVTDRPTLDYLSVQFDEGSIPWGARRGKYRLAAPAPKPVLVHEMSNLSVLPDPADIPRYDGIVKPFWLERMAEQVEARGLEKYLPAMLAASRRLQASLLKLNLEAARLSPDVDGYYQWLFRDYWTQSTGFVNQFDQARALTPEMARRFNAPAVLLWERERVNFYAGEAIPLRLFLSDFRPAAAQPGYRRAQGPGLLRTVQVRCGSQQAVLSPPPDAGGRGLLGPWTGTLTAPAVATPQKLVVQAEAGPVRNRWPVWVFPRPPHGPGKHRAWRTAHRAIDSVPCALCPVLDGPMPRALCPVPSALCTRWLTESALRQLAEGGAVWLTDAEALFPVLPARFKTAWWKGDAAGDHNYGSFIPPHPALQGFPHDGYGDLQMAELLEGQPVVLLEDVPGGIEPIVWCLDVPWEMRRKAYLFEARVGAGRLLVSTLNFSREARQRDPAADWLFHRLRAYVHSPQFQPAAELPLDWLRERVQEFELPDLATWVEGFARVLESTEEAAWYSYREAARPEVPAYPVRQTDGQQRLRWATAPVPAHWPHATVTFVWAGGIGWHTEPGGGHFSLALDGVPLLDFPFVQQTTRWTTPDGAVRFQYVVRRVQGVDSFGLFFLTVPTARARPGQAVELTVTATAQQSRRWFALNPYRDVVAWEREED